MFNQLSHKNISEVHLGRNKIGRLQSGTLQGLETVRYDITISGNTRKNGEIVLVLCQSKNSIFRAVENRNPNLRLDNQHQTTHKKKGSWLKPLTTCSISLSFNCERTILSCLVNQGTRSNTHIYAIPAAYRLDLDADKKLVRVPNRSQHT